MPNDSRQAGQDTEVTAAMIEAGVQTYLGYCPDTGVGDTIDRKMVADIYASMVGQIDKVSICISSFSSSARERTVSQ